MVIKDPKRRKEYHSKYMREVWYPKNRKKHISYVSNLKKKILEYLDSYKRSRKCIDCGFPGTDFPRVLEFDHILDNKNFEVSAWSKKVLSLDKIKKEIEKCELVCANCHRIRTLKRKENYKN